METTASASVATPVASPEGASAEIPLAGSAAPGPEKAPQGGQGPTAPQAPANALEPEGAPAAGSEPEDPELAPDTPQDDADDGPLEPAVPAADHDPADLTRDVIGRNPRLKKPALRILKLVQEHGNAGRGEVERLAGESWSASFCHTPSVMVDILVRNRALIDQVYVDGKPYAGTLEDVQLDDAVPEDAEVEERIVLTKAGHRLLEEHGPGATLRSLFASHPHYADVYRAALWACSDDGGCSRTDLEAQIKDMPQLQPDPETGRTRVYPQYFIDALESAGGIEWDGAWRITTAGKAVMEEEGEER